MSNLQIGKLNTDGHLEPSQTSKMELFVKIVKGS